MASSSVFAQNALVTTEMKKPCRLAYSTTRVSLSGIQKGSASGQRQPRM